MSFAPGHRIGQRGLAAIVSPETVIFVEDHLSQRVSTLGEDATDVFIPYTRSS